MAAAGSVDAFRQCTFVLGAETDLLLDALNAESELAEGVTGAKFRNQVVASSLALWSRSWLTRLQALHAVEWGNYAAALPLVRAAADYQAAQLALLRASAQEWNEWLDSGGLQLAPEQHATEFRLHAFRSAETMAAHEILGPVYRTATDLSLPHFGATLLVAGMESDPSRIAVTFGDRDFHIGWAELILTHLLLLAVAELEAVLEFDTVFGIASAEAVRTRITALRSAATRRDRCSIAITEIAGEQRYLISNWRRNPAGAPVRILL